ncbi:WHG domain-containing protein [Streptomyces sp. NPDC049099]|uniref:TetR/AcrR family transcriptional regulator n=1 Tax=Streptomyces sp. NPDC049099 TaxID=3155768 RepID=UPI0034403B9A
MSMPGAIHGETSLQQAPSTGVQLSFFGSAFVLDSPEFPLADVPLEAIYAKVESGTFPARLARVFRFDEIVEAHRVMEAGSALARQGGPQAVVLRAATRQAEVAPNAAYRHFAGRDALLHAVSQRAMAQVARTKEAEQAAVAPAPDAVAAARARFRAVGTGYLRFAQEEPGLFRTAFHVPGDMTHAAADTAAGGTGKTPFELLGDALDGPVATGLLAEDRRPGAEFLAWWAVHGLAVLLIDGPPPRPAPNPGPRRRPTRHRHDRTRYPTPPGAAETLNTFDPSDRSSLRLGDA